MTMELLIQNFQLGSLQIRNRIAMAPMTRNKSKRGIPGDDVARYYQKRAEGGVGLIVTEGTIIDHKASNGYPDVPHFFGEEALKGWKRVLEGVHQAGGKIFPQIWHVGSIRQSHHHCHNEGVDNLGKQDCSNAKVPGYAPSPVPHPYVEKAEIPHEMTLKDIEEVIEAFAKAALDAKKLGFDGVEIHGAHGYLIDQFFWDRTNKRQDQYGGKSISQRVRFGAEVVQAVRNAVGPDFPIDFRFSQWKLGDYEAKLARSPMELESFLDPLSKAGVDLFHCSTRRFWEPEFADSPLNLAGWTKKIAGKPTITVGSVGLDDDFVASMSNHSPPNQSQDKMSSLLKSFQQGEFDLVAVGRCLLADPFWFQKIIERRFDEIIPFSQEALKTL